MLPSSLRTSNSAAAVMAPGMTSRHDCWTAGRNLKALAKMATPTAKPNTCPSTHATAAPAVRPPDIAPADVAMPPSATETTAAAPNAARNRRERIRFITQFGSLMSPWNRLSACSSATTAPEPE